MHFLGILDLEGKNVYLQDTETQNSYKRSGNGRGGYLIGRGHINSEIWYM